MSFRIVYRIAVAVCVVVSTLTPVNAEQTMTIYLTGYSYWDNTPRGSAQIARPVIHRSAGGIGTYADPVTLAVGHQKRGSRNTMDFPKGTRFYFPKIRKYAIVEDLCGDGNRPQNGPCHSGYNGFAWLDIYVGGRKAGERVADNCMRRLTGIQSALINPSPSYLVSSGELSENGCPQF